MRKAMFGLLAVLLLAGITTAQDKTAAPKSQTKKAEMSNAQYTALALSAAPHSVAKDAGVARPKEDGSMDTMREGKNGFTCMVIMGDAMCADAASMAFFEAMTKDQTPPDKLGIAYMLRGDNGASNTDPHAMKKTADNHWLVTGPHIMIVGAAAKSLDVQTSADPDPTKPYLMWGDTPYAHVMIPVGGSAPAPKAMAKK